MAYGTTAHCVLHCPSLILMYSSNRKNPEQLTTRVPAWGWWCAGGVTLWVEVYANCWEIANTEHTVEIGQRCYSCWKHCGSKVGFQWKDVTLRNSSSGVNKKNTKRTSMYFLSLSTLTMTILRWFCRFTTINEHTPQLSLSPSHYFLSDNMENTTSKSP